MAWENIKSEFSDSVKDIYTRLSEGAVSRRSSKGDRVKRGTFNVYKERFEKTLRREVRRMNEELD